MRVWACVRSVVTGHQFCVSLERLDILLARKAVVEVRRHAGQPHQPKPRRPLGAGPSRRRRK